jgi:hypothetical protein
MDRYHQAASRTERLGNQRYRRDRLPRPTGRLTATRAIGLTQDGEHAIAAGGGERVDLEVGLLVAMRVALAGRYNTVRPFLTLLGESSALRAAPGGERVLAAVQVLPELARRRVAQKPLAPTEIATQWPELLRVAGSLVTNQVRGYDLLRMFGRDGHPTPLGQGFIEYGRIAKTLHLLTLADPIDDSYQRRQNRQLTIQESRHRLARKICHGNRGQIHQPYREGQEDQLAALGLVLNAVVLWNTRCLDAIVEQLRQDGQPVRDEDAARLSPLGHAHLNCLGRYAFTRNPPSGLRPLRDPSAPADSDEGW